MYRENMIKYIIKMSKGLTKIETTILRNRLDDFFSDDALKTWVDIIKNNITV